MGPVSKFFNRAAVTGEKKSDDVEKKQVTEEMCELKRIEKTAFLFFFF